MNALSVAIVAKNESHNIVKTLSSVTWADEIVVIDSGSTDNTVEIAKSYGATVYHESWKGYGPQVNSALDKCAGPWILNLDADEVVTPELAAEVQSLLRGEPSLNAYAVPRLNLIFGRWMRHGGLYPDRKLRLFRKGAARLREDTEPHATPKTSEQVGTLKNHMLHYQYPTLETYIDHMNKYSSASVPLVTRRGKTSSSFAGFIWNTVFNPLATFCYNYIARAGFLDGREGLIFHLNHSVYVNWKYVKAWKSAQSSAAAAGDALSPRPLPPDKISLS